MCPGIKRAYSTSTNIRLDHLVKKIVKHLFYERNWQTIQDYAGFVKCMGEK